MKCKERFIVEKGNSIVGPWEKSVACTHTPGERVFETAKNVEATAREKGSAPGGVVKRKKKMTSEAFHVGLGKIKQKNWGGGERWSGRRTRRS